MKKKYYKQEFLPNNPGLHYEFDAKVNRLGYRTKEFENINWQDSVVVFGCSSVFGYGVKDDETITYHLEKILNRPVINMGVSGSSVFYSWCNQVLLAEKTTTPYAVVNLWTAITRLTYFGREMPMSLGPWPNDSNLHKVMYHAWLLEESNPEAHAIFLKKAVDLIWKNTKQYHASFFDETAYAFNIDLLKIIDFSDDNFHPGVETTKIVAKIIADNIS